MRLNPLWALLAALPLAAAPAPESYTLKVKREPDPGKGALVKSVEKQSGTLKLLDGDKVSQEVKLSEEKEEVYTLTVLERGEKRAKKYKKAFEKAVRTADGKPMTLAYQGRTVVYDLKDGKYQASAEGSPELDKHVLDELTKAENGGSPELSEVLVPRKAVAVGDKWELAGKDIAKNFAAENVMTLDPDKTRGDVRLTKVYQKDGHPFGVIEATLKLAITNNNGVSLDPPGTMDLKATVDTAIDGASTAATVNLTGTIVGKGSLKQAGQTIVVDFHIDVTSRGERSAEK